MCGTTALANKSNRITTTRRNRAAADVAESEVGWRCQASTVPKGHARRTGASQYAKVIHYRRHGMSADLTSDRLRLAREAVDAADALRRMSELAKDAGRSTPLSPVGCGWLIDIGGHRPGWRGASSAGVDHQAGSGARPQRPFRRSGRCGSATTTTPPRAGRAAPRRHERHRTPRRSILGRAALRLNASRHSSSAPPRHARSAEPSVCAPAGRSGRRGIVQTRCGLGRCWRWRRGLRA